MVTVSEKPHSVRCLSGPSMRDNTFRALAFHFYMGRQLVKKFTADRIFFEDR